jgi:hypothetical protein
MGKKSFTFIAVLAVSTTLSLIRITAQPSAVRQNAANTPANSSQTSNPQTGTPQTSGEKTPGSSDTQQPLAQITIELRAIRQQAAEIEQRRRNEWEIQWSNWITQGAMFVLALYSVLAARIAFYLTHRPRIIIRNVVIGDLDSAISGSLNLTGGTLRLANIGETDAFILKAWHILIVLDRLPMSNPANDADAPDDLPITLPPGAVHVLQLENLTIQNLSDFRAVRGTGHDDTLFLIGWVKYRDRVATIRRTYFCHRFDAKIARFIPVEDPDYSYTD